MKQTKKTAILFLLLLSLSLSGCQKSADSPSVNSNSPEPVQTTEPEYTVANDSDKDDDTDTGTDTDTNRDLNTNTNSEDDTADLKQEDIIPEIQPEEIVTSDLPVFSINEISEDIEGRIIGLSFPDEEQSDILLSDLRYLKLSYYDFNGKINQGELICNKAIAEDLLDIFEKLFEANYPIEKISLIDDYNADDESSMRANNTSCFCYRKVSGSDKLSNHSLGLAIDINPLYNPYVKERKDGSLFIQPETGAPFVDRNQDNPYFIKDGDLCLTLFREHGFTWGGDYHSLKDYQHFEKNP